MTDKVQKIREWVKARLDENAPKQSLPQFYGMMEEDARFLDFINSLQEEPVSEELEEAAIQFATDTKTGKVDVVKQSSFFWGAIYHKQQMMKDAIETIIIDNWQYGKDKDHTTIPAIHQRIDGCRVGDKVKIIVIKEG